MERSSFETGLLGDVALGRGGRGGVGNFDNAVMVIRTGPSSEAGFTAGSHEYSESHTNKLGAPEED